MPGSAQSLLDQYGAMWVTLELVDGPGRAPVLLGTELSLSDAVMIARLYHHTTVNVTIHTDQGDVVLSRDQVASLAAGAEGLAA